MSSGERGSRPASARGMTDALQALGQRLSDGPALAFFILMLALIVGPRVAERVRLPAMVGLVLAGMLVGPHGIKILATDEIALSAWGNFGLLYLMFAAGLELDLKLFARMKKAAITFARPLVRHPVHARHREREAPELRVGRGDPHGFELGLAHPCHVPAAPADGPRAQPRRGDGRRSDGGHRHVGAAGPRRRRREREEDRRAGGSKPRRSRWASSSSPSGRSGRCRASRGGSSPASAPSTPTGSSSGWWRSPRARCSRRRRASTASWAPSSRVSG